MTNVLRLSACLLLAASLVACNQSDAPAPAGGEAAPGSAEAPRLEEQPAPAAPAAIESSVTLTMPKVRSYVQAVKNLHAIGVDDVTMEDGETVAQYEARLSMPEAAAAIEQAGMSVSEFARFGDFFIGAVMAQEFVDAGQLPAPPEGMEDAVEFVRQNKAEIDALIASAADLED